MKRYEMIVVGAGPAGLSASIEAAKAGMKVICFDENAKPGGQLFKQIHKFFGSKEHKAKRRGYDIGFELLKEAEELGVEVRLNAAVIGIYEGKEITVVIEEIVHHYKADAIIIATGASENMVTFPGWTLPGVIGAGAAQTMMNLHGIRPGSRVLMLGTGNVGVVVGYQLIQAGCELVAMVDAAGQVGGYGVHAAKVARTGVPFYLSHTIIEAQGNEKVEKVTIGEVNDQWNIIKGTEKTFDVDTICLAVGLSPMSQLVRTAGCEMNGFVPKVNEYGETTISGIYAAGDVSGIEEASSAMIEGRIAGADAAYQAGYLEYEAFEDIIKKNIQSLDSLRQGMFGPMEKGKKHTHTDEGIELSSSLLKKGFISDEEIGRFPGLQGRRKDIYPVIECTQNIPCNPCQDVCIKGCISIGDNITKLPSIKEEYDCTGCGMCVTSCPGQAIFLIKENHDEQTVDISIPYEFLPIPQEGEIGVALDRQGNKLCSAKVVGIRTAKAMDKTYLLTMRVPLDMVNKARFFKKMTEGGN